MVCKHWNNKILCPWAKMLQLFQHAQNNDLTTKMTLSIIQIWSMHAIKNQAKLYHYSVTNCWIIQWKYFKIMSKQKVITSAHWFFCRKRNQQNSMYSFSIWLLHREDPINVKFLLKLQVLGQNQVNRIWWWLFYLKRAKSKALILNTKLEIRLTFLAIHTGDYRV